MRELSVQLLAPSKKNLLPTQTTGLIHDLINILTRIQFLCDNKLRENPEHTFAKTIAATCLEAKNLAKKAAFVDNNDVQKNTVDLCQFMSDQTDMMRALLPNSVRVELRLPADSLKVCVDELLLKQVILNLTLNSREALHDNKQSKIVISLSKVNQGFHVFTDHLNTSFIAPYDGVYITFFDNGRGIPEAHLEQIFDPYFSTKNSIKPSGLGLYNVNQFFEANQGAIGVESHCGLGTTLHMYLPRTRAHTLFP